MLARATGLRGHGRRPRGDRARERAPAREGGRPRRSGELRAAPTPASRCRSRTARSSAILCIDALNHLPGRSAVFADWARLLAPGGRLLFTDPVTITGLVGAEELAIRSSIGYFDFAPLGEDERLLVAAGLKVLAVEDLTEAVAGGRPASLHRSRAARRGAPRRSRATRASSAASGSSTSSRSWPRAPHLALRVPRAEAGRTGRASYRFPIL